MQTVSCLSTNKILSEENLTNSIKRKFFFMKPTLKSSELKFVRCFWIVLDFEVKILNKKKCPKRNLEFYCR